MVFGNWAKILISDLNVVANQDKAYMMYFHERNNFAEDDFPVRPLLFTLIEIIGVIGY